MKELLPDLLSGYVDHLQRGKLSNKFAEEDDENVDFGGSSGTVEDTCVKVRNHSSLIQPWWLGDRALAS